MTKLFVFISLFFGLAPLAISYPVPVDFDGQLQRWNISINDSPIKYEIKASGQDDISYYSFIVEESANMWTGVPQSYISLAPANEGEEAQITIDLKGALGDDFSAGYAVFDKMAKGGYPTHCQINVSVSDNLSYVAFGKTILHELGHCLGLGHSLVPESIMSYYLDNNEFGLDIDDEAAISRLYPQDGSKPKLPPGCSIGNYGDLASQDGKQKWPIIFLIFPLMGLVLYRFFCHHQI